METMQRNQGILVGAAALVALVIIAFLLLSGGAEPSESPVPSASPSLAPSATPELNAELLNRRWTVLYVGTDLSAAREEEGHVPNTDALMVVSVSADQSEVAMISLPRDTVDVPLPGGEIYAR